MSSARFLALGLGVLLASFGGAAQAQFVFQVEGGSVNKKDTYQVPTWDVVNLKFTYQNPIIIALPNSNGDHPADFRIRNVTPSSFELTLAEPPSEDGPHVAMQIAYVAVDAGQWSLPDNQVMAAGFVSTNQLIYKGGGGTQVVPLPPGLSNPIVFAQIQGQANEQNNIPSQTSSPWLTVAVRNVTAASFELALDGCECTSVAPALNETIGWLAIDGNVTSSFVDTDNKAITYETIKTGSVVPGWSNGSFFVPYGNAYATQPLFVAKLQTRNETDGGWPRFLGSTPFGVSLRVDEDRCQDAERLHAGEAAGLFVFSQSFRIQDPDPDGDGIASSLDNCPFIANPNQENADGDAHGDVCDNCVFVANDAQTDSDADGEGNACDCGDGVVVANEDCDDGNAAAGDGCSLCGVETGWTCSGSPSVCVPICGDGMIIAGETCDDANSASGDGCSATCTVEHGYICEGEPSQCFATCGDGLIANVEGCDDANTAPGDGCSDMCAIELGWSCTGEPSICTPGCGDAIVAGSEECDDGNTLDGDGCSSVCTIEPSNTGGGGAGGSPSMGGASSIGGSSSIGSGGNDANPSDPVLIFGRGCNCQLDGRREPAPLLLLLVPLLLLRRRRRCPPRNGSRRHRRQAAPIPPGSPPSG